MIGIVNQVRNWIAGARRRAELDRLDAFELSRVAGDVGVSVDELRVLAGRDPDAAHLLSRRARAIGVDIEALARMRPALVRDMQRLCAQCRHQERCEHDMDYAPASVVWRTYCPNAPTLRELQ